MNYYNEINPYAAQWLRNLIAANLIPPGFVDERSIIDVKPAELRPYTQCHFFAGIGGWSAALSLAAWPVDREIWTGSCPCQPFSAAGRARGFADERHLWPYWFHLIGQCRPQQVFGEQVASKPGLAWLDLVRSDLESASYAFACADLCAAGVGAPHIRQRLWWMAYADERRSGGNARAIPCAQGSHEGQMRSEPNGPEFGGTVGDVGDTDHARLPRSGAHQVAADGEHVGRSVVAASADGELVNTDGGQSKQFARQGARPHEAESGRPCGEPARSSNDGWSDPDWLPCTDGKARPIEPGTFPLAHGLPARVGRLRAYGNAIVPQTAAEFIKAYMACQPGTPA